MAGALLLLAGVARAETHAGLQAVDANGLSTWTGSFPFTLTGVLLCDPEEMLDSTPEFLPWDSGVNSGRLGAEWQIAFQAVEPDDRGGTFCYLGQNYGNQPWIHNSDLSYANEAWTAEALRLDFDPATMHRFRSGDLIQVTVRQALFYGGKLNINEGHSIDPAYDFTVSLVTSDYGLPEPEVLTLADLKHPDDTDLFDPTRATGGEHWQGMRVRINGLTLTSTDGWNPTNRWSARLCVATDGAGRSLPLRVPRYSLGPAPEGVFDAVGIFNQESGSGRQGTNGYELFVQQVIPRAVPAPVIAQKALITWPASSASFQVEYATDPDATDWSVLTNKPVTIEGQNAVLDSLSFPRRYYRLRKTD